jgi:GR25 family glycosyltransferase involved in LPS biosynthesis
MNNPLRSSEGPGYFRGVSKKNKAENLARIIPQTKILGKFKSNPCKFPTQVYVVNLDRRQDRWQEFKLRNSLLFQNFEVSRFSALEKEDRQDAIFESHFSCLQENLKNSECIIVMEDDAYLAEGWLPKLKLAFQDLPSDWDCLIGNHYFFGQMQILTPHLAQPLGIASTVNFVVYRKTILEKISSNWDQRKETPDFDHFITSEKIPIQNYTIWPMISREYLSFSDHKQRIRNMEIRVAENSHLFQFVDSESYYPSIPNW